MKIKNNMNVQGKEKLKIRPSQAFCIICICNYKQVEIRIVLDYLFS